MALTHFRMEGRRAPFTFIEMMGVIITVLVLIGILMPVIIQARQQAKFARWFAFNKLCSRDPACVINFNFQDGYPTDRLINTAEGYDFEKSMAKDYNGVAHNPDWTIKGRWRSKRCLQFNGLDTWVDIPCELALDFNAGDDFTILTSVRFNDFNKWDVLFSKADWTNCAQYDLYFDGVSSGGTATGQFSGDAFKQVSFFNNTDVNGNNPITLDRDHWYHLVLRFQSSGKKDASGNFLPGTLECFVNGVKVKSGATVYSAAKIPATKHHLILGAVNWTGNNPPDPNVYLLREHFNGLMDEFIVYKRALTDAEILGQYNMGRQ